MSDTYILNNVNGNFCVIDCNVHDLQVNSHNSYRLKLKRYLVCFESSPINDGPGGGNTSAGMRKVEVEVEVENSGR